MKQMINHDSSENIRLIGSLFSGFGIIMILAGIIWAIAGANQYDGTAIPGLALAVLGVPSAFFGSFIKGSSVVVRAAETYLHLHGDEKPKTASTKTVSEIISSWATPVNNSPTPRNERDKADYEIKNDPVAEEYRPTGLK